MALASAEPSPQDVQSIESTLRSIFEYYAQVATGKGRENKPLRLMTSSKFQRMVYDANIFDDKEGGNVSPAQVDLIFRQACGKSGRLTGDLFMDAMVLLALAKFPLRRDDPFREFGALKMLFDQYLATFSGEDNDPLEPIIEGLDEEWYALLTQHNVVPVLHDVYLRYFPIEVNSYYKQSASSAHSAAHKGVVQLMEDFAVARQVKDLRAAVYAAVRDVERTAIPTRLVERIQVIPVGTQFTFHHFLLTLQKLADMQHQEGSPAQKLAQFLHVMEQNRSPWGKVKFLPSGLVWDANEVVEPAQVDIPGEVKDSMRRVYDWYVALGEPLKRELSTRKFNRFLRDAGLLSDALNQSQSVMGRSTTSQYGARKYAHSPTKAMQQAMLEGRVMEEDLDLPLLHERWATPPLTQVDVDLIFVKARQGKQVFSLTARRGFTYRERGEYGSGYYLNTNKALYGNEVVGGASTSHLDFASFQSAVTAIAQRLYCEDGHSIPEALQLLRKEVLDRLIDILADLNSLLNVQEVAEMRHEMSGETAMLFKSVWDGLDKVWRGYLKRENHGWRLEDFVEMCTEFKVSGPNLKPLIVQRVFYAHAKHGHGRQPMLTFESFLDALVLLAEKVETSNAYRSSTARVLSLLHHMNQVSFRTRMAHVRPLFVLPNIPEVAVPEKQPTGWGKLVKSVEAAAPSPTERFAPGSRTRSSRGTTLRDRAGRSP